MSPIERVARYSDPGYLERIWAEANGEWMTPRNDDLRAFLSTLARELETKAAKR